VSSPPSAKQSSRETSYAEGCLTESCRDMTTTQKLEWARLARILFLLLWAGGLISILTNWYDPGIPGVLFVAAGLIVSAHAVGYYRKQACDE
jgi:hypothetical protein